MTIRLILQSIQLPTLVTWLVMRKRCMNLSLAASLLAAQRTLRVGKRQWRSCVGASSSTPQVKSYLVIVKTVNGIHSKRTGLVVLERNYLLVYPYDKWVGREIPEFVEGEEFLPSVCELGEGKTSSPTYLTEADLITLMDKNGIGIYHITLYGSC
jgi:DNA topoisomerase IA